MSADPTPIETGGFLDIDVAADGTVVGLDASGDIVRWDRESSTWNRMVGEWPTLSQVSVGSIDDLWALGSSGEVYQSDPSGGFRQVPGVPGTLLCVSAGADGTVLAVASGGEVLRYESDQATWQRVPAPATMRRISVGSSDTIEAIDEAGYVHTHRDQDEWTSEDRYVFQDIRTCRDGARCAITADGKVSIDLGAAGGGWYELADSMRAVAIGSLSNLWGLDTEGRAVDLTGGRGLFAEGTRSHHPQLGWDAQDPFDDTRSTHLWIVNQAARLAALDLNPGGRQIYQLIKPGQGKIGDPFHDQLCQGLFDADWLDEYRGPKIAGLQPSYAGHFYDPDTKQNWLGTDYNTAVTNNRNYGDAALAEWSKLDSLGHPRVRPEAERGLAGYNLGLALHYVTDITQPMHSSNFTQVSSHPNFMYHGAVETYAMSHQSRVEPPPYESPATGPHGQACPLRATDSCGVTACSDLGLYGHTAARNSKDKYSKTLIDVAASRYYGWDQDPTYWARVVDPLLEPMLRDAILFTAQYLVAWMEVAKRSIDYNDAYGPHWKLTEGYLTQISVAADGSVWGVGLQHPSDLDNIYRWTGSGWELIRGQHLTSIAVGSQGNVWGVNTQQAPGQANIYRWTGSRWESVAGQLTNIAASSDGAVWGVNARQPTTQNNVYRWSGSRWEPKTGYLTSIAAAAGDQVWGVNMNPQRSTAMSNVFRWTGATWELVGGKYLTGVSVANDNSVWGVDALQFAGSNNVYAWDGRNWDARDAFLTQVVNAGGAQVWGINADHIYGNYPEPNIYRWLTI